MRAADLVDIESDNELDTRRSAANDNTLQHTITLVQTTLVLLASFPKPLRVLSFCGLARQGKSTCANLLVLHLMRAAGLDPPARPVFAMSSRQQACTVGIQVTTDPICIPGVEGTFVVVDTEGSDRGNDLITAKLMAISALFSDVLVYHHRGPLSGTDWERLLCIGEQLRLVDLPGPDVRLLQESLFPSVVFLRRTVSDAELTAPDMRLGQRAPGAGRFAAVQFSNRSQSARLAELAILMTLTDNIRGAAATQRSPDPNSAASAIDEVEAWFAANFAPSVPVGTLLGHEAIGFDAATFPMEVLGTALCEAGTREVTAASLCRAVSAYFRGSLQGFIDSMRESAKFSRMVALFPKRSMLMTRCTTTEDERLLAEPSLSATSAFGETAAEAMEVLSEELKGPQSPHRPRSHVELLQLAAPQINSSGVVLASLLHFVQKAQADHLIEELIGEHETALLDATTVDAFPLREAFTERLEGFMEQRAFGDATRQYGRSVLEFKLKQQVAARLVAMREAETEELRRAVERIEADNAASEQQREELREELRCAAAKLEEARNDATRAAAAFKEQQARLGEALERERRARKKKCSMM